MVSPDSLGTACPLSGRNSTYRLVQISETSSLLLGTPGYTFGLGFAVRQGDGIAGVAGSAGEFMWAVTPAPISGWIVGVYMTQATSPIRAYYRKMFKSLVY
jgi:hypothetical protein